MKREKIILAVIAVCVGLIGAIWYQNKDMEQAGRLQEEIAGKIIRFHVLANSDTRKDQNLKLKVRDRVIAYLDEEMNCTRDMQEAKRVIQEKLGLVEREAEAVVTENGCSYPVHAYLKKIYFPEKSYDKVTLPEGIYQALQIQIGAAKGHNWWCVIYPGLCFVPESCRLVADEKLQRLENLLTEEEYDFLEDPQTYKIGWRWF